MHTLVCSRCEQSYPAGVPIWQCECGGTLDLDFEASFDLEKITPRAFDMWRYREALPLEEPGHPVSLGEPFTPLLELELSGHMVHIKQDHLFPTGSYKDRGAAVLVSRLRELGISRVLEDSSGNAGCAVAAYCARAGITCHIYAPRKTSLAKLTQIRMYGAELHLVSGTRSDTSRAALQKAEHVFYASHVWNPYFFHGTKTFAFECCEQLGWNAPDAVVLPVGNGTLLLGAAIGFRELLEAGLIHSLPRLVGVQASACAPLHMAFHQGLAVPPAIEAQNTLAEGIAVLLPERAGQILQAVRATRGTFLTVSEAEITITVKEMGASGFFIEPTAAVTLAGLKKYLTHQSGDETILTTFTGHGLKAIDKMARFLGRTGT